MHRLMVLAVVLAFGVLAIGCDYTKKHDESLVDVESPGVSGHNVTIRYRLVGRELTGIGVWYSLDGRYWYPATRGWGGEDQDLGMRLFSSGIRFINASDAVSRHLLEGTLSEHVQRTALYGEHTVPVLVERHPELHSALHLDFLGTVRGKLAVNSVVFHFLYILARMFDPLSPPMKLYDYLTFTAYARGWLKGKRS